MKLICPGCGSVASAESWLNDALCRETLLAVAKLPAPLPLATLGYISLFRPGTRALTWKKAKRLVIEVSALAELGYVQIQGEVARPCPPRIWAQAMEQMQERRDGLTLPMPNHTYLKKVAWGLADQQDAAAESTRRTQEAQGFVNKQVARLVAVRSPMDDYMQCRRDTKPTDEEMDAWKKKRFE